MDEAVNQENTVLFIQPLEYVTSERIPTAGLL